MTVAVIGIGLATAADVYRLDLQREREAELLFVGRQMREAIRRYYEAAPGQAKEYPDSLESLLKDPRSPGIRRHVRRIYADPITGKAEWGLVTVAGRIVGVHSLSSARPLKVANFEPSEAHFAGSEAYQDWVFTFPAKLALAPSNGKPSTEPGEGTGTTLESRQHLPVEPRLTADGPVNGTIGGRPSLSGEGQ